MNKALARFWNSFLKLDRERIMCNTIFINNYAYSIWYVCFRKRTQNINMRSIELKHVDMWSQHVKEVIHMKYFRKWEELELVLF